jgi:hypothetical protein
VTRGHPATWLALFVLVALPASLLIGHARPGAVERGPDRHVNPIAPSPAGTLDHALARPLFAGPAADRADGAITPPDEADPDGAPKIVGIVGRLPDHAVVLVRRASGGTRALSIGESFAGWRLESIAPTAASFTNNDRRVRAELPIGDAADQ